MVRFLPALSVALTLAPLVAVAACGSKTSLDLDDLRSVNEKLPLGDGGLEAEPPIDASITLPPRDDAGRILSCGVNLPGPPLVIHKDYFGKAMCIDATEVTNAQYAVFLAANPARSSAAACALNTSYTPAAWPVSPDRTNAPVVNVDWCDAQAFCTWANKRLCTHHAPDAANPQNAGDPAVDSWTAACTGNRAQSYPYGANYDFKACNGRDLGLGQPTPVDIPETCEGSDPGIRGMSGNAWEWEDACADDSAGSPCLARGGSFRSDMTALRCDSAELLPRGARLDDVGFRCCVE
jgi:formylglycine-generating enzyme required for sulfatase activity